MESADIKEIFKTDSDGRFINLIIPELDGMPELNLSGKQKLELTSEEVTRLKIFARELSEKKKE
ncbi:MAG: hypothetical protein J6I76_19905 [Oribacterium sp.]|nr:hypothetical protein [Oribacterium sp.]